MPHRRTVNLIVIHCAATPNGRPLGVRDEKGALIKTAADVIDGWHQQRGFHRDARWRDAFNPQLAAIGYHYVIDAPGGVLTGRHPDERGAHVAGHNTASIGICMVGTDAFSVEQWADLRTLVHALWSTYGERALRGHRDLSPDMDGDGSVEPAEWTKTCPGFSVSDWWLHNNMQPRAEHICEVQS